MPVLLRRYVASLLSEVAAWLEAPVTEWAAASPVASGRRVSTAMLTYQFPQVVPTRYCIDGSFLPVNASRLIPEIIWAPLAFRQIPLVPDIYIWRRRSESAVLERISTARFIATVEVARFYLL